MLRIFPRLLKSLSHSVVFLPWNARPSLMYEAYADEWKHVDRIASAAIGALPINIALKSYSSCPWHFMREVEDPIEVLQRQRRLEEKRASKQQRSKRPKKEKKEESKQGVQGEDKKFFRSSRLPKPDAPKHESGTTAPSKDCSVDGKPLRFTMKLFSALVKDVVTTADMDGGEVADTAKSVGRRCAVESNMADAGGSCTSGRSSSKEQRRELSKTNKGAPLRSNSDRKSHTSGGRLMLGTSLARTPATATADRAKPRELHAPSNSRKNGKQE
ncbi:hypothetical protein ERJ75_000998900 [Trypanosoma vivax]|nr:hypothetical protein TRVL_00741 [Trypanosoma vivax]KAH8611499.1 hypothetical protein ERJ75_000998900 [Trypanosoma vivax]